MKRALFLFVSSALWGLPQNPVFIQGNGSVYQSELELSIAIDAERSIVHWDSFSIQSQEIVRMELPTPHSSVLNRVVDGSLSEIYGKLISNGDVWLINPAGVMIGSGGVIECGSFLAASFDVLNSNFLEGSRILFSDSKGSVSHEGEIHCFDGKVRLLSGQIDLSGKINAEELQIGAGPQFYLVEGANRELLIEIDPNLQRDTGYGYAIQLDGEIETQSDLLIYSYGEIALNGEIRSQLSDIQIFGDEIRMTSQGKIEAPMSSVWIGGSPGGKDQSVPHASWSSIEKGATIDISGCADQSGGSFVLWGNEAVGFAGDLKGTSGPLGGSGGFAEISTHGYLQCTGPINLNGADGAGTLLFDPIDVTITSTMSDMNVVIGDPTTYPVSAAAVINTSSLQTYLQSTGNVSITAQFDMMDTLGTITWDDASNVIWSSPNTLSLIARSIALGTNDTMAAKPVIQCTSTAAGSGPRFSVSATGPIDCYANISISGDGTNSAIEIVNDGSDTSVAYIGVSIESLSSISAANGDVIITGVAQAGDVGPWGLSYTGTATIADGTTWTLTGTGGGDPNAPGSNAYGIYMGASALTVGSTAGSSAKLILTGVGGDVIGDANYGVVFFPDTLTFNGGTISFVDCQGGGNITSMAMTSTSQNYGIFFLSEIDSSDPNATLEFSNITGGGSYGGTGNHGIYIISPINVGAMVMGSSDVTHIRSGATSGDGNNGIYVASTVSANTLNLIAESQGQGSSSNGITFLQPISVPDNGTWQITAAAGGDSMAAVSNNDGISLGNTLDLTLGSHAQLTLSGTGGSGTGGGHIGVNYSPSETVLSAHSTLSFANCSGGTDAGTSSGNHGVFIGQQTFVGSANTTIEFDTIAGGGSSGSTGGNIGIYIHNAGLQSGTITATSVQGGFGTAGSGNIGILVDGASLIGSTVFPANVNLSATAIQGSSSYGISFTGTSNLQAQGSGSITLSGTGAPGTSDDIGLLLLGTHILVDSGSISLTGVSGNASTLTGLYLDSGCVITSNTGALSCTTSGGATRVIELDGPLMQADSILFTGAIKLSSDFTASANAITCTSTINGAFNLSLGAATLQFSGAIGGTTPLASFTGLAGGGSLTFASTVKTTGVIYTFADLNNLGGNITTTGNTISINGPASLTHSCSLDSTGSGASPSGANVSFSSTITGATTGLTFFVRSGTAGDVFIGGNVGSTRIGSFSMNALNKSLTFGSDAKSVRSSSFTILNNVPIAIQSSSSFAINTTGAISITSPIEPPTAKALDLSFTAGSSIALTGNIGSARSLKTFQATAATTCTIDGDITAQGLIQIIAETITPTGTFTSLSSSP